MGDFEGSEVVRTDVRAVVKWFNSIKGFGFVRFEDGSPDAFLHASVLAQLGRAELPEGAEIVCSIAQGRKGLQVHEITDVVSTPEPAASPAASAPIEGRVKFFNPEKGFGFIVPDDGSRDVFVSARTLQKAHVETLEPDQRVRVTTRMGHKGPVAETLELA